MKQWTSLRFLARGQSQEMVSSLTAAEPEAGRDGDGALNELAQLQRRFVQIAWRAVLFWLFYIVSLTCVFTEVVLRADFDRQVHELLDAAMVASWFTFLPSVFAALLYAASLEVTLSSKTEVRGAHEFALAVFCTPLVMGSILLNSLSVTALVVLASPVLLDLMAHVARRRRPPAKVG